LLDDEGMSTDGIDAVSDCVEIDEALTNERSRECVVFLSPGDELGNDAIVSLKAPATSRLGAWCGERDQAIFPALWGERRCLR
jgi:hypothetical protein